MTSSPSSTLYLRTLPLLLALATVVSACATAARGPVYPDVSGTYRGGVNAEGQGIDGTLEVEQDGAEIVVVFDAPSFGLTAEGIGRVAADGSAEITLEYDLQCPGEAELSGMFSADGADFSGTLTASDCTGQIGGTFSFRR